MDLGKCPNQKTHESESAGFLVRALPEVQNLFQKQFSYKVLYNYYYTFIFFNTDPNAPFKKLNKKCNYRGLYEKNAFINSFGPWEVPELENLHFHFRAFSGWGTSRGPKSVLKAVF